MPTEILETIANINYNMPRPCPIDPAVLFDLIKIRKNVDEAADLAVRATSDTASPALSTVNGGLPGVSSMNAFGLGMTGHGTKLSRERRFRMRELASQKLARAYRLDEIASSVATMQGASTLEEIGGLVLQRSPKDSDAKYVHFFHEKIPSRQLVSSTSLEPLEDIMSARAGQPEMLRTLATVKVFKDDLEGAIQDLTDAITLSRFRRESHRSVSDASQQQQQQQSSSRRRPQDVILSEDEQPSGLDAQLLFQRGCVYLTLASRYVPQSLPCPSTPKAEANDSDGNTGDKADGERGSENQDAQVTPETLRDQAESRKFIKATTKRALRDLMAFISQFDYTPDLPVKLNKEFNERVFMASQGVRNPRYLEGNGPTEPHTLYPLSELFSAVPPANLPTFPTQEIIKHGSSSSRPVGICEWVTYHPLLTEALHSLLLCHCLAQTSAKELQRHAYMVARLVRLCDGYPVFQASRSPARTDWVEVLRRTKNWLDLCSSWENLCFPAPLPAYDSPTQAMAPPAPNQARASAAASLVSGGAAQDKPKAARVEAKEDCLGDKRATEEKDAHAPAAGKKKGAGRDGKTLSSGMAPFTTEEFASGPILANIDPSMWLASDEAKEYPVASDRSVQIAAWVIEAPAVTGTRRKKRVKRSDSAKPGDVAKDLGKLGLGEPCNA